MQCLREEKLPWRSADEHDAARADSMRAGLRDVEEGAKEAVQASKSPLAKGRSPLADLGIARYQPSCCHPRYGLDGQVRDTRDTMTVYFAYTCCETQTYPFVGVMPWAHEAVARGSAMS